MLSENVHFVYLLYMEVELPTIQFLNLRAFYREEVATPCSNNAFSWTVDSTVFSPICAGQKGSLVIYIYFSLCFVGKTMVILYEIHFIIFLGTQNGLFRFPLFLLGNMFYKIHFSLDFSWVVWLWKLKFHYIQIIILLYIFINYHWYLLIKLHIFCVKHVKLFLF